MKTKLINLGFEESEFDGESCLSITLNRGNDRCMHKVRWYEDDPNYFYIDFYIDAYKSSGVYTISEADFLRNHNDLSSNAVNHYLSIMDSVKGGIDENQ